MNAIANYNRLWKLVCKRVVNFVPTGPRPLLRRGPAVVWVVALLVAVAAVASPAAAQGAPAWDEDGQLDLSLGSVSVVSGFRYAINSNAPAFSFLNQEYQVKGFAGVVNQSSEWNHGVSGGPFLLFEDITLSALGQLNDAGIAVVLLNQSDVEMGKFSVSPLFATPQVAHSELPDYIQTVIPSNLTLYRFAVTNSNEDCSDSDGVTCQMTTYIASTSMTLRFTAEDLAISFLSMGTPGQPDLVQANRNDDYDEATVTWVLYDPVAEYEIQRLEATTVSADDQSRIEYGDSVLFTVEGTIAGVDEYVDDTIDPEITYQYRVRAKGADYGLWSAYAFSGARPKAEELAAPSNLEVARASDNAAVTVTWTAPDGDLDGYYVQRQQLVADEGSSFFADTVTFPDGNALSASTLTYTDSAIFPNRIYEYRVAAVKDDVVGEYSDWSRSAPGVTSLGNAPDNFRLVSEADRGDRGEYWIAWDAVDGADEYELEANIFDAAGGLQNQLSGLLVSDPTYFVTTYGRAEHRVRARKQDATLCGSGATDRCPTAWTGWLSRGFTPGMAAVSNPLDAMAAADAATMEMRADLDEVVQVALSPLGLTFNSSDVVDYIWLAFGLLVGTMVYDDGRRQGMAPLSFAVASSFFVIFLWLGIRLVDLPVLWGGAALVLVLVGGIMATAKSLGLFGR